MELVKQNIDQQGSVDEQTQQVSHFLYFPIKLLVDAVVLIPTTRGVVPVDDQISGIYNN